MPTDRPRNPPGTPFRANKYRFPPHPQNTSSTTQLAAVLTDQYTHTVTYTFTYTSRAGTELAYGYLLDGGVTLC